MRVCHSTTGSQGRDPAKSPPPSPWRPAPRQPCLCTKNAAILSHHCCTGAGSSRDRATHPLLVVDPPLVVLPHYHLDAAFPVIALQHNSLREWTVLGHHCNAAPWELIPQPGTPQPAPAYPRPPTDGTGFLGPHHKCLPQQMLQRQQAGMGALPPVMSPSPSCTTPAPPNLLLATGAMRAHTLPLVFDARQPLILPGG